jgi:hypothetical protein
MRWQREVKKTIAANKRLTCLSRVTLQPSKKTDIFWNDFVAVMIPLWWTLLENKQYKVMKQLFRWNVEFCRAFRNAKGQNTLAAAVDTGNPNTVNFVYVYVRRCVDNFQEIDFARYVCCHHPTLLPQIINACKITLVSLPVICQNSIAPHLSLYWLQVIIDNCFCYDCAVSSPLLRAAVKKAISAQKLVLLQTAGHMCMQLEMWDVVKSILNITFLENVNETWNFKASREVLHLFLTAKNSKPLKNIKQIISAFIQNGRLDDALWLIQHKDQQLSVKAYQNILETAIFFGRLEIVKQCAQTLAFDHNVFKTAVSEQYHDCAQFLLTHYGPNEVTLACADDVIKRVHTNGHFQFGQFLLEFGARFETCEREWREPCAAAAKNIVAAFLKQLLPGCTHSVIFDFWLDFTQILHMFTKKRICESVH